MTDENADVIASLLARAEAAEKEAEMYRREAAHARTLASGWAEANAERAAKNLHNDARKIAEARCATLQAELAQERLDHAITRSELEKACRLGPRVATLEAALREIADVSHADPAHPAIYAHAEDAHQMRRIAREALAESTADSEAVEKVVAAASVLGLSREETDELVRLVRSEGATTPPAEKEGT